jgi:hypothetical protein
LLAIFISVYSDTLIKIDSNLFFQSKFVSHFYKCV